MSLSSLLKFSGGILLPVRRGATAVTVLLEDVGGGDGMFDIVLRLIDKASI